MFVVGLLFEHVTMAMMMAVVVHTTQRVVVICVQGELTITADMEVLGNALFLDNVPDTWLTRAYPSMYGLASWYTDLLLRVRELESWISDFQLPPSVWLGGFFNPQSFLTAIMQQVCRLARSPLIILLVDPEVTVITWSAIKCSCFTTDLLVLR